MKILFDSRPEYQTDWTLGSDFSFRFAWMPFACVYRLLLRDNHAKVVNIQLVPFYDGFVRYLLLINESNIGRSGNFIEHVGNCPNNVLKVKCSIKDVAIK